MDWKKLNGCFLNQVLKSGSLILRHNSILRPKLSYISFIISILLNLAFRPGSVIVYFILYFKTAVTPEKGIENLRIAISSNGTFGDFQAKDSILMSEESTTSTKTTGTGHPIHRFHWVASFFLLSFLLLLPLILLFFA